MVGEQGREIVNLPKGSEVLPNKQTESIVNGGGVTVNLHMDGIMARSRSDLREIAKDMIGAVNEELRAKGKPQLGVA
jgi:phage-related tail protein